MPAKRLTTDEAEALALRNRRVIELRRAGTHWADIATEVKLSASRCHQVYTAWLSELALFSPEERTAWREEELDLISRGIRNMLTIAENQGEATKNRVEAQKEVRFHSESRRTLLGTDAPQKREIEMIDSASVDARLMAEIAEMEREARVADALKSTAQ